MPDAASNGAECIVAKIESVQAVDAFEQQFDLDTLPFCVLIVQAIRLFPLLTLFESIGVVLDRPFLLSM